MRVEEVRLHNFTSYSDAVVNFPPEAGLITIVGPNGAGKSSILDAIYYALYGESLRGGLRDIIRTGAADMSVELVFESRGRTYKITRKIVVRGKRRERLESEVELYRLVDGSWRMEARTAREVQRLVKNIVGVDKTMFLSAYYVRQGEIAALLSMEPAKRKKIVTRLLGIEYFEKAYEKMRDVIDMFKERHVAPLEKEFEKKEVIEKSYEELLEKLRDERKQLEDVEARLRGAEKVLSELDEKRREIEKKVEELREKENRLERIKADIGNLKTRIRDLEAQIKELEDEKCRLDAYRRKAAQLESFYRGQRTALELEKTAEELKKHRDRLGELEKKLNKIRELEPVERQCRELEAHLKELAAEKEDYIKYSQLLKSLKEEKEETEKRLRQLASLLNPYLQAAELPLSVEPHVLAAELEKRLRGVEEALEKHEEKYKELIAQIESLRARAAQLEKWLDSLEKIREPRCPLCGSPLTEEHKAELAAKYKEELREIERRLRELDVARKYLEGKIKEYKARYRKLSRLGADEGKMLLEEYQEKQKKLENLGEQLRKLNEMLRGLADIEARIKEIQDKLGELEGECEEYRYLKAHLEEYARERGEAEAKVRELEEKLSALRGELEQLGIAGLKPAEILDRANQYLTLRASIEELEKRVSRLTEYRDKLKRSKEELSRLLAEASLLEKEVSQLEEIQEKYKELSKHIRALENEKGRLSGLKKSLQASIEEHEEELTRLKEELDRLKTVEEKLKTAKKVLEDLKKIRDEAFHRDKAPRLIREKAVPRIQRVTRELLDFFDMDIGDIRLKDDFSLVVVNDRRERSIHTLSGGEQVVAALSFRLAIARSASEGYGLLMFDEPTANLDDERRALLVGALKKLYSEGGGPRQMIIVTHDRELEDAADMIYHVAKRPGVGSVVEQVG